MPTTTTHTQIHRNKSKWTQPTEPKHIENSHQIQNKSNSVHLSALDIYNLKCTVQVTYSCSQLVPG
jgi:hypothetical protein